MEGKELSIVPGEPIYFAHSLSSKLKQLWIAPISDIHYGNPLFSLHHLNRTLNFIAENEHVFTVLNGDLIEASLRTSKGDIFKQVGTPQDQRDWIIEKLLPIKDKILGMVMGNHEDRLYKEVGVDFCADIAKSLHIPYRREGLLLKLSFGRGNDGHPECKYTYFLAMTHGYGGARTKSAKAVKVERLATWIHADVYIMSHDHVVNTSPDVYLMPDPRTHIDEDTGFRIGKVTAKRKMLVKTNAYLKWGGYSEMGGFPPVDLETPIIKFAGSGKPKVKVEV